MDKDKATICLELYKIQTERFKDTRQIQWKINLAFWTFILVSSSFLYGKYQISLGVGIVAIIIVTIIHALWCLFIQWSLEHDKNMANRYRSKLDTHLNDDEVISSTGRFRLEWLLLQVAVTIMFMASSVYFLSKDLPISENEPDNKIQVTPKDSAPG